VDLNSYAELAVRLVNTAGAGGQDGDRLANLDGLRALVADREHLNTGVTRNDLDSLRGLRTELRAFFVACSEGDGEDAAAQLNALLIRTGARPALERHDSEPWHLHFHAADTSLPNGWAAGCATGLAVVLGGDHQDRLGVCTAPRCDRVYVDTSRNATRRYCSTSCQNRVKTAAFRARLS